MNAPVREANAVERKRLDAREAANELLVAGEALCRAARVIASMSAGGGDAPSRAPTPTSRTGERLSGKQLGAIRGAARRAGLSRDRLTSLIEGLTNKSEPTELNRDEASTVIERLFALARDAR